MTVCSLFLAVLQLSAMSSRTYRKVQQYIDDDDLPKLKSYLKKHRKDVTLDSSLDENGNTCLHVACKQGFDVIVRYLLRKRASPRIANSDGDLPIHDACFYAMFTGRKHVYIDLITPLVNADEGTLDLANKQGVTARSLLKDIAGNGSENGASNNQYTYNAESSSDSSDESTHEDNWSEKLARAMQDDFCGSTGDFEDYEENYGGGEEDYDDWADRMYSEYSKSHLPRYSGYHSNHRKRNHNHSASDSQPKRPKISAEKRREFERKQKLLAQEELAKAERLKREKITKLKSIYELKCAEIFKGEGVSSMFRLSDIPWPEMPGEGPESMFDLLFCDLEKSQPDYKRYLKDQQVRWHPDRFRQKLGSKLSAADAQQIMDKVNHISQLLNQHSESLG